MLKEVIIVEGKMDTVAVKRALECDTIETGGFALNSHTLKKIEAAYKKRGIIILKPEAILLALSKVHHHEYNPEPVFSVADLRDNGLSGSADASHKRDLLGAELGIGYGTAKAFLRRLNTYGITREEFVAALKKVEEE